MDRKKRKGIEPFSAPPVTDEARQRRRLENEKSTTSRFTRSTSPMNLALSLIGFIILVGLLGFYLLPSRQSVVVEEPKYFEFIVFNTDLPKDKIEKFTNRFNEAKQRLEGNEDDFEAWILLGSAKKQVGDYQGATEAWIKAGEVRPLNSLSFNNLADLYTNFTKEYDKAESAYFSAVQNSTGEPINSVYFRNFYYFYFYNLEDNARAEAILLEATAKNPTTSDLPALLGYFYRDSGNTAKAIEYFEKTLELNPDNQQVKKDLEQLR